MIVRCSERYKVSVFIERDNRVTAHRFSSDIVTNNAFPLEIFYVNAMHTLTAGE